MYKIMGCWVVVVTQPHKLIGFGAVDVTKPYALIRLDGRKRSSAIKGTIVGNRNLYQHMARSASHKIIV